MHLDKLIGSDDFKGIIRSYVDEPSDEASDWTDEELLDYVNMEHRHLYSVIRGLWEDWFARTHIFPIVNSTYEYYLPMDCVNMRRVELIKAASVTGSSPNYTVDELTAAAQEMPEILLSQRSDIRSYTESQKYLFRNGYYLFDEKVIFEPDSNLTSDWYCRLFYLPQAPDLHRAVAQAAAASTITLGSASATTTLGNISSVNNYYKGMRIEIISDTGTPTSVGQLRRITQYAGDTKIATIDTAWTVTPSTSARYSIVSPIQEDYQELLALGAVIRAKGIKTEDDTSGAAAVYEALRVDLINSLDTRNFQFNRRVVNTRGRESWF